MNLFQLSWSNLTLKPLATFLSLLLLTMGVGIISLLLLLNTQLQEQFIKNIRGIDMVVGAKGSPLQLILSSVYQIDYPTGNISWGAAKKLAKNPLVKQAIPLAYGDNYRSYRIVGTEHTYLKHYQANLKEGQLWENVFEVTIGATVADALELKVGDTFISSHGLLDDRHQHEEQVFIVVGILENNHTVVDQLILTSLESVWAVHETEKAHQPQPKTVQIVSTKKDEAHQHQHNHSSKTEEAYDITAMLLQFRSPMGMVQLPRMINHQTDMQSAVPVVEVNRLLGLLGIGVNTLRAIAAVIMLISGISVFISLYNSLKDRKYELALMRTMGASRFQLFALIMIESLLLTGIGFVMGVLLSRAGMWVLSQLAADSYHYQFTAFRLIQSELYLLLITFGIGFLAALLPALRAFRLNISKTLASV